MKTELNVLSICGFVFCFKTVIIRRNNRVHTTLDDAHPAQTNDNSDAFYLELGTHPVTHNSYLYVYTSRYDPETLLSFLFYSLFSFFSLFFCPPYKRINSLLWQKGRTLFFTRSARSLPVLLDSLRVPFLYRPCSFSQFNGIICTFDRGTRRRTRRRSW